MNKLKNNYYIKVSLFFSLLSCLVPLIFWHLYIYTKKNHFVYDGKAIKVYFFLFIIESGLYLVFYGLGRLLNFSIRPFIILISFCDFFCVICGLSFLIAVVGQDGILIEIFRHLGFDLYFIMLFLSKFLLIYILKRIDKKLTKDSQ